MLMKRVHLYLYMFSCKCVCVVCMCVKQSSPNPEHGSALLFGKADKADNSHKISYCPIEDLLCEGTRYI